MQSVFGDEYIKRSVDASSGIFSIVKSRLDIKTHGRPQVGQALLCGVSTTLQCVCPRLQLTAVKQAPLEANPYGGKILAVQDFIVDVVVSGLQDNLG